MNDTGSQGRPVLDPGPDHPITIDPAGGVVTVSLGGTTVARSERALALDERGYPTVLYLPIEDVEAWALRPSEHTTYCPYKGDASYWSLVTEDATATDAVWGYPEARSGVAAIAGHVAFAHEDVTLAFDSDPSA